MITESGFQLDELSAKYLEAEENAGRAGNWPLVGFYYSRQLRLARDRLVGEVKKTPGRYPLEQVRWFYQENNSSKQSKYEFAANYPVGRGNVRIVFSSPDGIRAQISETGLPELEIDESKLQLLHLPKGYSIKAEILLPVGYQVPPIMGIDMNERVTGLLAYRSLEPRDDLMDINFAHWLPELPNTPKVIRVPEDLIERLIRTPQKNRPKIFTDTEVIA